MSYTVREPESKFTPAPEGLHQAVCVDVVDLGVQKTPWGDKEKVSLVWQIDAVNDETEKRFEVRKWYTPSLSEKANLRKDLETWRGRKFTKDELQGFDLETLIGVNCQLQIVHNISDEGKVYANVQAVIAFPAKLGAKIASHDYTRVRDRAETRSNGQGSNAGVDDDVEEVPF